jgi:pantothenate kinase type III
MVYGTASLIEGVIGRFKKELNEKNVKVILTGGISTLFNEILQEFIIDPDMLLEGLNEIYKNLNK